MNEVSTTDMVMALPPPDLPARVRSVRARVAAAAQRAGRSADDVLIIAVTKTVDVELIRGVYELGLKTFGENRVQEARAKIGSLRLPLIRWELIGHLQTNKVARAVEFFDRIQSVDSVRLAEALEERAAQIDRVLPVLLEVNVAGEASKQGLALNEAVSAARAIAALPHLHVGGLMTVAPVVSEPEQARPVFRQLRELRDRLRVEAPQGDWRHLSMGMTDDFEVAIEEGATLVRIGRALFGARPTV
ncbi:MAG: YggS family pyridoxal phosphate-dependent enzyme [Ktedonobacterales bacterium]